MNTLENVKQWFIDRDLENGGRLDKQSLKLSEEFGELCAGYLWNEIITTIIPVDKITVWQAFGMDMLLSFIFPVSSSKKVSEEEFLYSIKSGISKIITCAFFIWLASLFI